MNARHPNINGRVGGLIRRRRKALGVSLEDFAGRCGVTFQTLQKWETGEISLSVARLCTVAAGLGTTPSELLSTVEA